MRELFKLNQEIMIVPKDFKFANKGIIVEVLNDGFKLQIKYPATGIDIEKNCDFYSQTDNGTLYFESYTKSMENNVLFIPNPIKHRFLQRRKFTRIPFLLNTKIYTKDESFDITTMDISAGGIKCRSDKHVNIEPEYKIDLSLDDEQFITCKIQFIRIEKQDDDTYILSGRFVILNNIDKMTLINYCMKKNMELLSKANG